MKGRPKLYDEDEIIDKAIEVFREKCYDAASADELLAAMGIGKGSFYFNFKGGKLELYERSLKRFADKLNTKIEKEMDASGDEIGYLKQLFMLMASSSASNKDRGCYYGNALVQLSLKDKQTRGIATRLLADLHRIFKKGIERSQEKGKIPGDKNPETLAWILTNLWNGMNVTRRMEKSPVILGELVENTFMLLQ
jgi:TetR/AcrR family transcriptional repressor of nem operon